MWNSVSPVKISTHTSQNENGILYILYETWVHMLFSYVEFGILRISRMKTWLLTFAHEIWNFVYFTYEHQATDFSTQNMEF